jgi:hypothetical protein
VKAIEPFGRGKIGHARITAGKDRAGHVEESSSAAPPPNSGSTPPTSTSSAPTSDAPEALPVDDAGNMRPTHLMERVSRWLELQPNAGRNQIIDGVTGKSTYVRRAIDRLVQEGFVEVELGPNRQQLHRVITPFREDEDNS